MKLFFMGKAQQQRTCEPVNYIMMLYTSLRIGKKEVT